MSIGTIPGLCSSGGFRHGPDVVLISPAAEGRRDHTRPVDVTGGDVAGFEHSGLPVLRSALSLSLMCLALICGVLLTGCGVRPPATPEPTTERTTELRDVQGWTLTAETVGLAPLGLSCDSLPVYTGPAKPLAGTTISGQLITNGLDLSAGGIMIERSCIQPTSIGRGLPVLTTTDNNVTFLPGPEPVTIRDSEIDGSRLGTEMGALSTGFIGIATVQRNYVHHLGSGIALFHSGASLDALIENNYVTDLLGWGDAATTGNHSDAFTIRDFSNVERPDRKAVIRNNRFDCDSPNPTGAFFIQAYAGRIDNVTIEGNLLEGSGYQLALEAKDSGYSNITATDNRFSGTGFGAVYVTGGPGFASWQDNYVYAAAAPGARGTAVSEPQVG